MVNPIEFTLYEDVIIEKLQNSIIQRMKYIHFFYMKKNLFFNFYLLYN